MTKVRQIKTFRDKVDNDAKITEKAEDQFNKWIIENDIENPKIKHDFTNRYHSIIVEHLIPRG